MRIKLTARQIEALRPYLDQVQAAAVTGNPGMLVAQIIRDGEHGPVLIPAFLEHELAKVITEKGREVRVRNGEVMR